MLRILVLMAAFVAAASASSPGQAATRKLDPASLKKAQCAEPLEFDEANGTCKLRSDFRLEDKKEAKDCPTRVAGFSFANGTCSFDAKLALPQCDPAVANLVYDAQSKQCLLVTGSPTSSPGAYVGDCFKIIAAPSGSGLNPGRYYAVTDQRAAGDEGRDRALTVVDGDLNPWPVPGLFGCSVNKGGQPREVLASSLMSHGAQRFGWTYGALTMPYKYYPSSKSFVAGLPIGAYLGWRMGRAGSGITAAAAFTLSQVKADTVDPKALDADGKPTVTGSTDVAALSGALGLVYDLSKEPGTKAYKAGLFFGKDRINRSPTIDYLHDRKWWMALQLGFDFTDF